MSGGSVKGWLPDVAVVLWRRMLGALGNINTIADTVIHAQVIKFGLFFKGPIPASFSFILVFSKYSTEQGSRLILVQGLRQDLI